MCVLIDVAFSGLFRTSTRSPSPNPVFAIRGERSVIEFLARYSVLRLVKPDNDVMFEMLLLERDSHVRLVKFESTDTSEIPVL